MNQKELDFILLVKSLPCCVCDKNGPSEADHVTDRGRRLGHAWVIPLCVSCHRGDNGYGSGKSNWDKSPGSQLRYCRLTYQKLGMVMPMPFSKIPNHYERMLENYPI